MCVCVCVRWTYFFLYGYIILIFKRVNKSIGTNVCRCNWLDYAGSLGWPFPMLKYKYIKYIFQIKFVKAIISLTAVGNFLFNIPKMRIAVKKINLLCYFFSFPHTSESKVPSVL